VADQAAVQDDTHGQVGLYAGRARTATFRDVTGGKQHRHAGREGETGLATAGNLITVIEDDVAEPGTRACEASAVHTGQRVAELMPGVAEAGPLLSKGIAPILAVPQPRERADVVNHSALLVVGLLDQKAVVLDLRLLFGGSLTLAGQGLASGNEVCHQGTRSDYHLLSRDHDFSIWLRQGGAKPYSDLSGPFSDISA
jgi:hypothetical protein